MIFYFSATGNSRIVAKRLGEIINERVCDVSPILYSKESFDFSIVENCELIGFVFPIHSWGIPSPMVQWINDVAHYLSKSAQLFMIATCGDDIGKSESQFRRLLKTHHLTLDNAYSLQMPNTYVSFPYFDVDSKELENRKLANAAHEIVKIANDLRVKRKHISRTVPGAFAWVKSTIIYPLFLRHTANDKKFSVSDDCVGCGICVKSCPLSNIKMEALKPEWQGHCINCLSCYHHCPVHAINYGKFTRHKGQSCNHVLPRV